MNAGLVALAFRRSLAPGVIAVFVVLAALGFRHEWAGSNALLDAAAGGGDAAAAGRGLAREGLWTLFAVVLIPLIVSRAGRTISVWRAGESEWLASRASGRLAILASTWLGTWLGGALVLTAASVAVELRAGHGGSGGSTFRRAGELALPAPTWIEGSSPLAWSAGRPAAAAAGGARARIELGFGAGSGSAAEVTLRARRANEGERLARARIASRGAIEVEIPPGTSELRLELACAHPGARAFVISDAVELWTPCANEIAASAAIFERLVLALACWTALALGFGAWVSPPSAVLALLAGWIPAWIGESVPAWLPGADLWDAFEIAGSGRVPGDLPVLSFAVAAALVATGLGLGAAGLRGSWRAP